MVVCLPIMYTNVPDSDSHSCTVLESPSKCRSAGGTDCAPETNCDPCNEGADVMYVFEPITAEVH